MAITNAGRIRTISESFDSLADRFAVEARYTGASALSRLSIPGTDAPSIKGAIAADEATFAVMTCGCGCGKTIGDHPILADDIAAPPGIADEGNVTIAVGGSATGLIDFTGDTDKIRVDLIAGKTYTFSLRGTGDAPLNDSFLQVKGPGRGATAYSDDDGGNGLFSLVTFTAETTGTYTITAASFANPSDPGLGEYTVDVLQQKRDSVGADIDDASKLRLGTTFGFRETGTGGVGGTFAGDSDFYRINLSEGKLYNFLVSGGADYNTDFLDVPTGELDTVIRLYNAAGELVASNDDLAFPDDISSGIGFIAEEAGTYYLEVTAYAGNTGGYVIDVTKSNLDDLDPLDSINWFSAENVEFDANNTAYVYFGSSQENFGETGDDGGPMVTIDWNATERAAVMESLEEYEKILGVNYEITTDVEAATFRLLKTESQQYGAYFYPQDPAFGDSQGIGVFNVLSGGWNLAGQDSLNQGGYSFGVILHEFGHAHGLAHPHDTGGGSDVMLGVTGPDSLGVYDLNQGVYTVMSYNDAWQKNPDGPSPFTAATVGYGWSGTLSAFDIAVLQERYGVLNPTATGNTTYTLDDVNADGTYYEAIWDTGGRDKIVYNGSADAFIDLTAATIDYSPTGGGVVSYVDGIFGGYTIARGVVIERAIGSTGNDTLIGGLGKNVLKGGKGDDSLYGADGRDVLIGGGGEDSYYVKATDAGDADHIRGFVSGADKIVIYSDTYGIEDGTLDGKMFAFGKNATDLDQRLVFDGAAGKLFYDADGAGAGDKVLIAMFEPGVMLTSADILVI